MASRKRGGRPPGDARILELVERIYDAALDPDRWTACLEDLASATFSSGATLALHDLAGGVRRNLWWVNADPELVAEDEAWAARNPFIRAAGHMLHTGLVGRSCDFVPMRDVQRSEYFNDYLRRVDFCDHIAACLAREHDVSSNLFLMKPIGSEPHDASDVALVRVLLPHLQRALAIHRRLEALTGVSSAVTEVLDRLPFGVVLLDERGSSLLANRTASAILASGDGLALSREGRLEARSPSANASLARSVAGACATGRGKGFDAGGTLLVPRMSGGRPLAILITPLRVADARFGQVHPVAAVFLSDPERGAPEPREILRRLYGFTPAESVVAWMLLAGKRIADVSEELAVTENTVRTHVKRVLAKADCRSQADLVRVLMSGPAGLAAAPA
jgi:DNA-binding CsgD family transcriptional regulator